MIKIYTDSAADITRKQAAEMSVGLIPLKISFQGTTYYQEDDEGFIGFYELLKDSKYLPTTSQASPAEYMQIFEDAKKNGDSVIIITISSKLSGTVLAAHVAKENCGYADIFIIDSLGAVISQRILVEYAVTLRDRGLSASEIYDKVMEARLRVRLWAFVDTLEYLHKGGRLSKSAAFVGGVLNIKPIIHFSDGALAMTEKARGVKSALRIIMEHIEEDGERDEEVPVYFAYSGADTSVCENFRKMVKEKFNCYGQMYPIGGVVGIHVGPNAMAIVYLQKKK
ncbi:MAG: DegV family protein [Chloroflexi bacterium]|nr:DegV family protein [Chloroflexota bacterium]